jgi:hypothetical protein
MYDRFGFRVIGDGKQVTALCIQRNGASSCSFHDSGGACCRHFLIYLPIPSAPLGPPPRLTPTVRAYLWACNPGARKSWQDHWHVYCMGTWVWACVRYGHGIAILIWYGYGMSVRGECGYGSGECMNVRECACPMSPLTRCPIIIIITARRTSMHSRDVQVRPVDPRLNELLEECGLGRDNTSGWSETNRGTDAVRAIGNQRLTVSNQ